MSARTRSVLAVYGVVAAVVAAVVWPLLAIAYFDTAGGVDYLDQPTVSAWAVPGREVAGGLVTWGSADRVYATYSQVLMLMFPAVILLALVTRRDRSFPQRRAERIGWRVALTGYSLFALGGIVFGLTAISADLSAGILDDVAFVAMMLPGMLLSFLGSTVLGLVLLRSGYRPRLTAVLLTASIPLFLFGNIVLGHNGFGVVMLLVAWAVTGWHRRTPPQDASLTSPGTAMSGTG